MSANRVAVSVSEAPGEHASCESGLSRQFGRPHGLIGSAVGHLMAVKNARMNRAAVEMFGIEPRDEVLEIGFGPGTAIRMLAARATEGFVAGVDVSEVMVRQASRRNQWLIRNGPVALRSFPTRTRGSRRRARSTAFTTGPSRRKACERHAASCGPAES